MPIPFVMSIDGAILQFGGSLVAILALAGIAYWMRLGSAPKIQTNEQARAIANEVVFGFKPIELAIDTNGAGAILADQDGRIMVLKPHGTHFAGRILSDGASAKVSDGELTVTADERRFGAVSLKLPNAEAWAKRIEGVRVANHA
jgi:hypothetical protein